MRYKNPDVQDRLAAEYVLGSLRGAARRRFERLLLTEPGLKQALQGWTARLHPLTEELEPRYPPADLWLKIEQKSIGTSHQRGLWSNLSFWRGFSLVAASVTLAVTLLIGIPQFGKSKPDHVVFVTNTRSQPVWVVKSRMKSREFEVKTLMDTHMPEDKVCVLWLVWKDGKTQSLGVLSDNVGKTMMKLPKNMDRKTEMAEVAVSVEKAGEKMEEPQGEIMFKGPWVEL